MATTMVALAFTQEPYVTKKKTRVLTEQVKTKEHKTEGWGCPSLTTGDTGFKTRVSIVSHCL